MLVTVTDYKIAIKEIRENPEGHRFSKDEVERVMDFEKSIQEFDHKFGAPITKIAETISQSFSASQSVLQFEEKLKDTKFVVNQDWFISFNLIRGLSIKKSFEFLTHKNNESVTDFVLRTFPAGQAHIFHAIHKAIPHRKSIISEIDALFKARFYHAVIVLCYTQVDGICNENLNYGFFDTDNKTYDLKIKELESNDSLASKFAIQLKEPKNEMNRYVKKEINEKTYKLDSFNRHLVLHGHSTQFGTQVNAIRAILLLDFVCSLITEGVIKKI